MTSSSSKMTSSVEMVDRQPEASQGIVRDQILAKAETDQDAMVYHQTVVCAVVGLVMPCYYLWLPGYPAAVSKAAAEREVVLTLGLLAFWSAIALLDL